MSLTTPTATAARFTAAQRAHLIVAMPARVTADALAHKPARYAIAVDADGATVIDPLRGFDARRWIVQPACHPEPDHGDPRAGRGWWEGSAGMLVCPVCFPAKDAG